MLFLLHHLSAATTTGHTGSSRHENDIGLLRPRYPAAEHWEIAVPNARAHTEYSKAVRASASSAKGGQRLMSPHCGHGELLQQKNLHWRLYRPVMQKCTRANTDMTRTVLQSLRRKSRNHTKQFNFLLNSVLLVLFIGLRKRH